MSATSPVRNPWRVMVVVATAVFMVTLDNLVVTTAVASIRRSLSASLAELEWIVNAYTVTFGVLMLLGAVAGDRFGRRRVFLVGLLIFTLASAVAATTTSAGALVAARAVQGVGGAIILPLTLSLLAAAFDESRRGVALGVWSGVSGLGVALGPLVGGLAVEVGSWRAIFWIHVPVGLALVVAARILLPAEGGGGSRRLDGRGAALATAGMAAFLVGLVLTQDHRWLSWPVVVTVGGGAVLVVAFVHWERRCREPLLPLLMFRSRTFTAVNVVNVAMYFGMFGSIFLLAPFLQTVQGHSPIEAGLRILPWTVMPLLISPLSGACIHRFGARSLIRAGLTLQAVALAWIAVALTPELSFAGLLLPCLLGGTGMALVYPPAAATLLSSVQPDQVGVASGVMNSLRELAGACGIAALGSVFTATGGGLSANDYVRGLTAPLLIAAAVLLAGALLAARLPGPAARVTVPEAVTVSAVSTPSRPEEDRRG
jgi:EmrB/QacA subfamily drug resistance transporter